MATTPASPPIDHPNLLLAVGRLRRMQWIWAVLFAGLGGLALASTGIGQPFLPMTWITIAAILVAGPQPIYLSLAAVAWAFSLIFLVPGIPQTLGADPITLLLGGGPVEVIALAVVRLVLLITAWNQFLLYRLLYGTQQAAGLGQTPAQSGQILIAMLARERFYATQVRPDRRLPQDDQRADLAGRRGVRAPAELFRVVADLNDAHHFPVLVAEKGQRPQSLSLILARLEGPHGRIGDDAFVGDTLDLCELTLFEPAEVAEIEPQASVLDERTRLLYVLTQHLPERPVQQVGACVTLADSFPPGRIDPRIGILPDLYEALRHHGPMAV